MIRILRLEIEREINAEIVLSWIEEVKRTVVRHVNVSFII